MVVTSHHMDEVDKFCDRIALIDRGRIVAVGTPTELKARVGPDATLDDVFIRLVTGNRRDRKRREIMAKSGETVGPASEHG